MLPSGGAIEAGDKGIVNDNVQSEGYRAEYECIQEG